MRLSYVTESPRMKPDHESVVVCLAYISMVKWKTVVTIYETKSVTAVFHRFTL